ncbi:MAG: PQQ-binding-like beta-propeller repeat protein [Methylacidiphilales bacterium]|nr:PQQ-binding-like beta-propeller repeat protein [Candidatus Methylacidiphilales bacterium]
MKITMQGIIAATALFVIAAAQGQTGDGFSIPSGQQPLDQSAIPKFGTFWFLVGPYPGHPIAPLPCPPADSDAPIYDLGDGQYLIDDSAVDYSQVNASGAAMFGTMGDPSPLGATNSCPCCSYPTNTTLLWSLEMADGPWSASLSLAPDGTLYIPVFWTDDCGLECVPSSAYGNVLWSVNTSEVNTNDANYPLPDDFTNWVVSFPTGWGAQATPVVGNDGTVYTSSGSNSFSALDRLTGSNIWTFNVSTGLNVNAQGAYGSIAVGADGAVYLAYEYFIYAITNAQGSITTFSTPTNYYEDTAFADTYTVTNAGIKWIFYSPDNTPAGITHLNPSPYDTNFVVGSLFSVSCPVVGADGTLYVNTDKGQLFALSTNGSLKWVTTQSYLTNAVNGAEIFQNVSSPPVIGSNGIIYFGSMNNVFAIDPHAAVTNEIMGFKWAFQFTSMEYGFPTANFILSPAIGPDGTLYCEATGNTNLLFALDSVTGTPKWTNSLSLFESTPIFMFAHASVAVAADGEIYLGDRDGLLYCFCPNGNTNWAYQVTDPYGDPLPILGPPLIGPDGTIYVANTSGELSTSYVYAFAGPSPIACSPWPEFGKNARHTAAVIPPVDAGHLRSLKMLTNGFQFTVSAPTNLPECICATPNLLQIAWTNLGQMVLSNGPAVFLDTGASNYQDRFYEAFPQ